MNTCIRTSCTDNRNRLAQQWLGTAPSDRSLLETLALDALRARGWAPDYLTVRRRADLLPATADDAAGTLVALGAARLGLVPGENLPPFSREWTLGVRPAI